jgi:hypothetical protein
VRYTKTDSTDNYVVEAILKLKLFSLLLTVFVITGCETLGYEESVAQRPSPIDTMELTTECGWIENEITRVHTMGEALSYNQLSLSFKEDNRRKTNALITRSDSIGC